MSFQAFLSLEGSSAQGGATPFGYPVLECEFEVSQGVSSNNLPNRATEISPIHLVVESTNSNELLEWGMTNITKNGNIRFTKRDASSPLKTLSFGNAFCIRYKECFNSTGELPMRIHITISPFYVEMQGIELQQRWTGFRASSSSSSSNHETTTSPQREENERSQHTNTSDSDSDSNNERTNRSSERSQHTNTSDSNTTSGGRSEEHANREHDNEDHKQEDASNDIPSFRP